MKKILIVLALLSIVVLSGCETYKYSCDNNYDDDNEITVPPMVIQIRAANVYEADNIALEECRRRNCDVSIKRLE